MYAKCLYCKKRFILKVITDRRGNKSAGNYVVVSQEHEEPVYVHKTCYLRYKRDKAKEKRKFGVSGSAFGVGFGYNQG